MQWPHRTPSTALALRVIVAAFVLTSFAEPALADTDQDAPVYAVQNRQFNLKHEFHLGFGVLPINAYTKGLAITVGYTFHFSQLWAWEIAQFSYAFGADTDLKRDLLQNFNVQPTATPYLNYFASTNAVFKPLYGKFSLTNRWLVHVEAFLAAGLSVGVFSPLQSPKPGFDAGGGLRFYLNDLFSIRIDIRDLTYFTGGSSTSSELYLGLAAAVSFGGGAK